MTCQKQKRGTNLLMWGDTIKSVLEAVTLNTLALQHMDQLRREMFLTVLPHNMKSLAERPKGSHEQLFGDITERQIEAKAKAEVVASLMPKPQKRPLSGLSGNPNKRARTTAGNIEARGYTDTPWESTDTGGKYSRKTGKSLFVLQIFHPRFGESQARVLVWDYV